jgi:MHS family shikimate/dehydroshikimate transporter-like MFS transporter
MSKEPTTGFLIVLALASTAGLTVEFYSFVIYGYAASQAFPKIFFPSVPATLGVVLSFLTFAAGFPARVVGGFIFGHFGDRIGRSFAFFWDLIIIGISSVLIAVLPGADVLGLFAPTLLVILRFVQGLGLGGEFGGATSLLAEFASRRKHRAFWVGFANAGFSVGGALGALALLIPNFSTTGWRIAFLLSLAIVVPSLIARYIIKESPFMVELIKRGAVAKYPSISVFKRYLKPIILLSLFSSFQQFDGYTSLTYMVDYMSKAGYELSLISFIVLTGRIFDFAGVFMNGWLSQVTKRKLAGYLTVSITTLLSYPYVLSILSKNIPLVLVTQSLIVFLGVGTLHALAPVLTSEQFPTKYRYSGSGIAYELSSVIGGMFTPSILAYLIGSNVSSNYFYIPLLYLIYGLIAIISVSLLRETKGLKLEELDKEEEIIK